MPATSQQKHTLPSLHVIQPLDTYDSLISIMS